MGFRGGAEWSDFAAETAMTINERNKAWSRKIDEIGFLLDARGARTRAEGGVG